MLMMAALTILSVGVFAQDTIKQKIKTSKQKPVKAKYTCSMHPDVMMDKAGKCPKCGARLFEGPAEYLCEKSQADSRPCKFKIGKVILQQPIDHAQLQKLLTQGKTDLLEKFVSAKTGRTFKAWLVLDESGKASFEFPPRDGEDASGSPN